MATSFEDIDHLLRRAGFGGSRARVNSMTALDWAEAVEMVLDDSNYPNPNAGLPDLNPDRSWWERIVDMNHFWFDRAATIDIPLGEKMVLFWHGLLCSGMSKVGDHQAMFDQNQLFRTQGLGNFRTLVHAASLQPAMLLYLDNHRNRSGNPNENFARELMELFVLGVGHYSETDVRESARAWTGYGLNEDEDTYVFHADEHDGSQKAFMGTTRNWNGPQIIDHLFDGPKQVQASRFIMGKLFSFFAYPDAPASVINELGQVAVAANYDIKSMLRAIFNHPQFRSDAAKNGLVRSPIEVAIAIMRSTGMAADEINPEWSVSTMGQEAFDPPNVAGWKQNEYWISASTNWARSGFYSRVRWHQYSAEALADIRDLEPPEAVTAALDLFGVYTPTAKTRQLLEAFVAKDRVEQPYGAWSERTGLLYLPMTTPEFQLA